MKLAELPIDLMSVVISSPRQEALDFLDSKSIPQYILRKYESLEDRADAFDGAFVGFNIQLHLSHKAKREDWYQEVLGCYDFLDQKNINGPFFDALKSVLDSTGFSDFYAEAINYIIDKKGKLEY